MNSMNSRPSELDDLLPLHRRGLFNDDVESYTREAIQTGHPLGLVMIDLDHFKKINDQYGHPVGDEVLRAVAGILRKVTGTKGTCYRYGGEEMCILLPNYSVDEVIALAERVRREIEAASITGQGLKVTASVGVAVLSDHAMSAADLLRRADEAVYEAKNLGRNLIRISGEPRPSATTPRVIERRQPEPGGTTEAEKEEIRTSYFRSYSARCPRDGASLQVREWTAAGRITPNLIVTCPLCGLDFSSPGPT